MCRHEAAEALGALGWADNLDILREYRDRKEEDISIVETCEIAIERIEWENSAERQKEKLRPRSVNLMLGCP
jgi:deoxyhypusine monooxygenase